MQQKLLLYSALLFCFGLMFPAYFIFAFFIYASPSIKEFQVNDNATSFRVTRYKADTLVLPGSPVNRYDIVMDEVMADPTPSVALPDKEWIELRNVSANAIDLAGFTITDGSGNSGTFPAFILAPDSLVIACATGAVTAMAAFGKTVAISRFPSLNNNTDQLTLFSAEGKMIHAIHYATDWYKDDTKKNGGWSLEMMDTRNPCAGISNWKASTDKRGGSPGIKNATDTINTDKQPPRLKGAAAADSLHLILDFDEPLDSASAANSSNYLFSEGIGTPVSAVVVAPLFTRVSLQLSAPLIPQKTYTLTISRITDCSGNAIAAKNSVRIGLTEQADSFDIVINEVLFNPPVMGSDYVELYNRSHKIIDLNQIFIANRNSNGSIGSSVKASANPLLFFPDDYIVLTKDIAAVKATFLTKNPEAFITTQLPALNIDRGNIIILNTETRIIDQLSYSDQWHFKLLNDTKGIALERADFNAPTQAASNWHSAATDAGYGTPGYKNSQFVSSLMEKTELTITPGIISPDGDGMDDFATISYRFAEPGNVANITIFNTRGKPVRLLQRNALCGTSGNFTWNGLGDNNQLLTTGVYIVYSEFYDLKGIVKKFKLPVVLATRN